MGFSSDSLQLYIALVGLCLQALLIAAVDQVGELLRVSTVTMCM
jgi:hypothetical protein